MGIINGIEALSMPMGLRENDPTVDERFLKYFSIVQSAAAERGSVFFLFCGEDHDLITDEIDCQDLSGWFIPEDDAEDFESKWRKSNWSALTEDQSDRMVTAVWSGTPENISVRFEPMP